MVLNPYITVIVPVYNTEAYLERCINSICNQTFKDFELILVDDGSTDGSGKLIDEKAAADSRIVAVHKPNGGSSSARNEGLKRAKGKFISFIDSDDYVEPFFLEKLSAPTFSDDTLQIVQIGRTEVNEDGTRRDDICTPPEKDTFIDSKEFFRTLIMHTGDCSFCTKLISRKLFETREFPVGKLNEDFHLLIEMLFETKGVYSLSEYGYHVCYRLGSNSRKADKNDFSPVFKDCIDNADWVEEIVKERFPDLKEVSVRFALFQRLEYLLHIPISLMNKRYPGYEECVKYVRKHFPRFLFNKYLTRKNKLYLTLFAIAPKGIRKVHSLKMRLKGN